MSREKFTDFSETLQGSTSYTDALRGSVLFTDALQTIGVARGSGRKGDALETARFIKSLEESLWANKML